MRTINLTHRELHAIMAALRQRGGDNRLLAGKAGDCFKVLEKIRLSLLDSKSSREPILIAIE